ncbi:MAG: strictosidine synthase family protein [Deltaproteobacteria bacterium]|nr:strictosidine synthase family protein [Deltaproteobacteria bacterium]
MRRLIGIVVLLVLVGVAAQVVRVLWLAGTFRRIHPHVAGTCRLIGGPVGPEDLTIHPRSGVAYVSASDRRGILSGRPTPGAIWAYDLSTPGAIPVNLTPRADTRFQPHGISLWAGPDGRDVLFVVNHPVGDDGSAPHAIEIFDITAGGLLHRATLTDPLLVTPNDLVAVGLDRFYVTNTHAHAPGTMQTIETYLQLAGAQVVFYGPGGFRPAITDLVFPNGIGVSPDGRTLYVASTTGRNVRVYDRDPRREALSYRRAIPLGSGADNIDIDADGTLWVAAHPKMLRVEALRADPRTLSPSQVLRVTPRGDVEEIYLDDGSTLSGSSVAAVRGNRLLIGKIYDEGFLDCTLGGGGAP